MLLSFLEQKVQVPYVLFVVFSLSTCNAISPIAHFAHDQILRKQLFFLHVRNSYHVLYPKGNMSKRTVRPPDRYLHENIEIAIDGKRAEDRKYCMSSCLYTDYYYNYVYMYVHIYSWAYARGEGGRKTPPPHPLTKSEVTLDLFFEIFCSEL